MTAEQLKARTKSFALRVVKLCRAMPRDLVSRTIGTQLLRCGTSVGSNYRSACRSRSAAEFVARMGVVEEEADESAYWMELLIESDIVSETRMRLLLKEANELCAIAGRSRITAASNRRNTHSIPIRKSEIGNRKSEQKDVSYDTRT